jgi:hypothetical protein
VQDLNRYRKEVGANLAAAAPTSGLNVPA